MCRIKKALIGVFLLGSLGVAAQQSEVYNQFFMNPYLYNPAYAGVEGHTVIYALYNRRWANISGSPQISNVSFHTPLKGGIGIGVAAFNDSQGPVSKSIGKFSASYLVTLDREHHLRFGLSVGGGTQGINFGELDDPTDPAFQSIASNSSFAVADFGITYHFGHFNFGFSIPNLISYEVFQADQFSPITITPLDNVMLKMNYRGHINHDLAVEPHLIYRYSNIVPDQLEGTVILHIYHIVWAGATYRQNDTYAATVGVKIKEKLAIGYGYELGNTRISGLLGPTHEVHIGFHLGTKKAHAAHVSSFIKSHQLTTEQRAALAAKEREEKLKQLQESRIDEQEQSDALGIVGSSTTQKSDDALGIVKTAPQVVEKPAEDPWKVDETRREAIRTNPFGEREKAIVIKHQDETGKTVYAVAWEPIEDNWELIDDEPPIKRQSSDGSSEIGVKYYRTSSTGEKELIIKWEPVVTESQVDALLVSNSTEEVLAQQTQTDPLSTDSNNLDVPTPLPFGQQQTETQNESTQQPLQTNTTPEVTDTNINSIAQQQDQEVTPQDILPQNIIPQEVTPQETAEIITQEPQETTNANSEYHEEKAKGDENLTDDFRSHDELADSDQHLKVTRGNHMLELPEGYYLVGGAFDEYEHAEDLSDRLFDRGYHEVIVGFLTARGYYYTVVSRFNSLNEANNAKARIKQRSGMSKVWVLHVTN